MASSPEKPVMIAVAAIRPNPWNPNVMPEGRFAQLVENARRYGFNGTVVLREIPDGEREPNPDDPAQLVGYEIVDGEHRWRVARALGMEKVPSFVREFTTAEAKAQTIAMNTLHGDMAPEDVARLVREIEEDGIGREDLTSFVGFTGDDLDALDAVLASAGNDSTSTTQDGNGDGSVAKDQSSEISDQYVVIVTCANETTQLTLAEKLEAEGFSTRLVIG